jgi:hypothetical protein
MGPFSLGKSLNCHFFIGLKIRTPGTPALLYSCTPVLLELLHSSPYRPIFNNLRAMQACA